MGTSFYTIYCRFLDKITDDLYMELTLEETFKIMDSLLIDSLGSFKFPRFRLYSYDTEYPALVEPVEVDGVIEEKVISNGAFEDTLTPEEIDILAELMLLEWFNRQLSTTRLTQMKYSTSDFKMTSQAAHMQRLNAIILAKTKEINNQQFMYRRRAINDEGYVVPNYDGLSSGEKIYRRVYSSLGALGGFRYDS